VYAFNWLADFAHTSVEHHQIYWTMITLENANAARIKIGKMPHTYLLLTKWIGRFWEMESELAGGYCHDDNFYIGTSVSDQATADERIPHLMKFAENGWKTWLSIEPMLGPVVLKDEWLAALNQVVVGGETGRDARKLEIRWVEDIQRQCHLSGVPFFLKSLGSAHKNSRELADGEHNELAWKIAK
jgi:protein gp37